MTQRIVGALILHWYNLSECKIRDYGSSRGDF